MSYQKFWEDPSLRKWRNSWAHSVNQSDPRVLEQLLSRIRLDASGTDAVAWANSVFREFGGAHAEAVVPESFIWLLRELLQGRLATRICDPWAGIGIALSVARDATGARDAIAYTPNETAANLGRQYFSDADWRTGKAHEFISVLPSDLDVIVSVLPFNAPSAAALELKGMSGASVSVGADLGSQLLIGAAQKLSQNGIAVFVVPRLFFVQKGSPFRHLESLDLCANAAMALPAGAFLPHANIATYALVVSRVRSKKLFVAQLSGDAATDQQIVANYRAEVAGATFNLGVLVERAEFDGIERLRAESRCREVATQYDRQPTRLGDIADSITLGGRKDGGAFTESDNAIYVPLIGTSDVVDSISGLTLAPHNYAQVCIDPAKSAPHFVIRYLNSDLGKEMRDMQRRGMIPKLNSKTLSDIAVFIPDLDVQSEMLAMEADITAEQSAILSIQNDLAQCRRRLWADPRARRVIAAELAELRARVSGPLQEIAAEQLDRWFETLPFPLASILRAWQATAPDDDKAKYEHLLHFFEGATEFIGIILLSAFSTREGLFMEVSQKLTSALHDQGLSFTRASFGTWKVTTEVLGKRVRSMLAGKEAERATCGELFGDSSCKVPSGLAAKQLLEVISATSKMRNDWHGHGGVVSQSVARDRNEQLLRELQKFRDATSEAWSELRLVQARQCRSRRGLFETDVAIMNGSNSEFLVNKMDLPFCLDVDNLYLICREPTSALPLLPFVQVGPSPESAKNACYFYSRTERDGLRYVSYHYIDQPDCYLLNAGLQSILKILDAD